MICPNCAYENQSIAKICTRCGELLVQASGTAIIENSDHHGESSPKYGSIRFGKRLVLTVLGSDAKFSFERDDIEEVVIGREDPDTGETPLIDLSVVDGLEQGVSRNHARIVCREDALHIQDNDSANGTFLNGQRLIAKQLRVLRDGDDIRVGKVSLRVAFV